MGLAKIFNESNTTYTVQFDGEGTLTNAANWFASKQIHVVKTEAGQHFRNAHVEYRHRIWKGMTRVMIDRTGFSIDWWYLVVKHAVLITNLILLESVEPDTAKVNGIERRRSVWEAHVGEQSCLESYLVGPFGCLAFLILTDEQRKARSGHLGDRSLQGLYLGCQVDGANISSQTDKRAMLTVLDQPGHLRRRGRPLRPGGAPLGRGKPSLAGDRPVQRD